MFIKVIDNKKFAYDFYEKGYMKFSTTMFFNYLDDTERGDQLEGKINVPEKPKNLNYINRANINVDISHAGQIDGFIYSISLVNKYNEKNIEKLLKFGNDKDEAHAVIIHNPNDLIDRFSSRISMRNIYYGCVQYVNDEDGYFQSVFHLKSDKIDQSEFRFFYNKISDKDMCIFNIGSLKDVACIVKLSELRDYLYDYEFAQNRINEKPIKHEEYIMKKIKKITLHSKVGEVIPKGSRFRLYKIRK